MERKRLLTSITILNQELEGTGISPISDFEDLEYDALNQLHSEKLDEYMEWMEKADERKEEEIFASYKALSSFTGLRSFLNGLNQEKFDKVWDLVFSEPETKIWEECLRKDVIYERLIRVKESDETKKNVASLFLKLCEIDKKARKEIFGDPLIFSYHFRPISGSDNLRSRPMKPKYMEKVEDEKNEVKIEDADIEEILDEAYKTVSSEEKEEEFDKKNFEEAFKAISHRVLETSNTLDEAQKSTASEMLDEFFKPKGEMDVNKILTGIVDIIKKQ